MKVVSLVDNIRLPGRKDLRTEPGLSLFVLTGGQQILFDAGLSRIFLSNARRLGVDVAQATLAVLSHHHSDHGGGLGPFLEVNNRARIYLRSSITERFHIHLFGVFRRRIGLDESLFKAYPKRFVFIEQFSEIAPGVFILTGMEGRHPIPDGNRRFYIHGRRSNRREDFNHELMLVVKENGGIVVFSGCSHHGILNMLDAVVEHFPGQPIKAVFGGFHLIDLPLINNMAGSRDEMEELGRAILEYPVHKVYTGHCTGTKAYRILKGVAGEKLEYFATGCRAEV